MHPNALGSGSKEAMSCCPVNDASQTGSCCKGRDGNACGKASKDAVGCCSGHGAAGHEMACYSARNGKGAVTAVVSMLTTNNAQTGN
jgi:hypothetical protein